jgi:putative transposase
MPCPSSVTDITTPGRAGHRAPRRGRLGGHADGAVPPSRSYFTAFSSGLCSTCASSSKSPTTGCRSGASSNCSDYAKAAKRFFKRLLKGLQYVPRVIVTDKLRSYGVAKPQVLTRGRPSTKPNSHRPTRRRERQMQRLESPEQVQDFLSGHAFIYGHFHPRWHRPAANAYRAIRSGAFKVWQQETVRPARGGIVIAHQ